MIGRNTTKALLSVFAAAAIAGSTSGFQLHAPLLQPHSSFGVTTAGVVGPTGWQSAPKPRFSTTSLAATSAADEEQVLDTEAIAKYLGAIVAQMALITGLFTGFDALSSATGIQLPFAANFGLFFVLALKSRIFNPLLNARPKQENFEIDEDKQAVAEPPRKQPEWMPPGVVFPIVWILIIGPLRAASTAILVTGGASYASPAVLALMLHLSIGDTWNTVNNVERRYGPAVVGVALVWLSAAFAAFQYGQVDPLAGKLLSIPLVWLTIASTLVVRTWQLNPNRATGETDSLLPTKPASQEGSITKLVWLEGGNN